MTPEEREVYLSSENGPGQVFLKECPNDQAEAHLVAGLIRELTKRDNLSWPDFAVLVRGWSQAGPVEQAFIDQGVPYAIYGERSRYYERREVRALYAYLRGALAVSGKSTNGRPESASMEGALEMLINTPARGIGPRSMQMIRGKLPEITWEALLGATVRDDLREQVRAAASGLLHLLLRLGRLADTLTPAEMIARVIRETGWEQALADELDGKSILRALRAFQDESDQYATLEAFVKAMQKKIKSDLLDQGVALSTIHAAKGLEWPAVFVVGLNQGVLPSAKSLQTAEKGDPVEERHVAHVAFSRARQLLMLTWARERLEPSGRTRALRPSEFLGRLPKEAVDEFATIHSIDTLRSAAEPGAAHDPADLLPGGGAQPEEVF
jgi:DNA helicase II / ATP-dependent DNA helicase PcrA